jgi:hypothetical protein
LKNVADELFGQFTFSHSVQSGGHSLSGSAFGEFQGGETRETWLLGERATNYTEEFGLTDVQDLSNQLTVSRRASFGGRLDYNYQQKYLLSALMRYDGSYRYAPDKRWGLFPGFSVGWRLTEEPFIQDRLEFLNELKLRASWGEAGREQIGNFAFLGGATYNVGDGSVFSGALVPGTRPRGLPVTGLSWVTSQTSNVGVDFVTLNGKFSGAVDLFQRKLTGHPGCRGPKYCTVQ